MEAFTILLRGEDKVRARLKKFGPSPGLNAVVGAAAANATKEYLFRLDNERANPLGGKRSHFYWEAAKNTTFSSRGSDTVVISIRKLGLRQRWLGGTINAINGKYLTIPARAESYGVRARDFPGKLKFILFKSGAAALVKDTPENTNRYESSVDEAGNVTTRKNLYTKSGKRRKKRRLPTEGLVEYWLVPSVTQQADPTAIPSPAYILDAVTPAVSKYISGFAT